MAEEPEFEKEETEGATEPARTKKKRSIGKRILIAVIAVIVVVFVASFIYMSIPLTATSEAQAVADAAMEQSAAIDRHASKETYVFTPSNTSVSASATSSAHYDHGLVFYVGAKVEPAAYAPLMQKLADEGWLCIIVDAPFHFTLADVDAADSVIDTYADLVDSWYVGGHSLGGMCSARYAAAHTDKVDGVILLGAYSDQDLSATDLDVIAIHGSNDTVLDMSAYNDFAATHAPKQFHELVIEGGNHAQFGNYGDQAADSPATITPEDQQQQTVDFIISN